MELPLDKFDQRPYLNLLETIGQIRIFEVDGKWIRKHLNREYTNWAQGRDSRFKEVIPPNEFWIDTGFNPDELQFFIDNMLTQWYLLGQGYSRTYAETEGIKVEERERKRGAVRERKPSPKNCEIKMLQRRDTLEIYLVDGKKVRKIDPRFCHGGHDLVYDYVPDKHVWIDNTAVVNEWLYLIIHEVGEHDDMAIGKPYNEAHKKWSRIEWECRWDAQELLRQQKQLGLI